MGERETYTMEQFQEQHSLAAPEAARLFSKFGPYKFDLDLIMAKKREFTETALQLRRHVPGGTGVGAARTSEANSA